MARPLALVAAVVAVALLPVSGAGGAAPQTPKRGGSVEVAATPEPACLNPLLVTCFFVPGARVLEGAFSVGPDLAYRPALVWDVDLVSKHPQTLVYRLRPQARWSDGRPLTARDFVFTYRAFVRSKSAPYLAADFAEMSKVVAVNRSTLKVVLRDRDPEWRRFFPIVLPRHVLAGEDLDAIWLDRIDNPKTGTPIGSGPFLVQTFERGRQLTLVRNPRYWGSHTAYLDRLSYRFIPPERQLEAFQEAGIDVALSSATTEEAILELRRSHAAGMRFLAGRGNGWEHFEIRVGPGGNPALRNRLVRRALAYAIDRGAIAKQILGGYYGEPRARRTPLDSLVFIATSPYYRPNWATYRYRPELVRRLLRRAGCALGGDGTYVCSGQRLSLRFITTAGVERRRLTLSLVQARLRAVGIEARLEFVPSGTLLACQTDCLLRRGDFDVALFQWVATSQLLTAAYSLVCQFEGNFTGYCDRLLTRDLNDTWRILDLDRRVRRLNGIDARLAKAVPWIPLIQVPQLEIVRTELRGVVLNPIDSTWNAEDWWLDR